MLRIPTAVLAKKYSEKAIKRVRNTSLVKRNVILVVYLRALKEDVRHH